ncbi:ceramide glucosyltransferase [Sporobolomyces koalae]|uniref:ceramide glucosyltransferase n=1 Tax=Sporobolomyces koalae TaxID=500713 RepID=UPI003180855D
MWATLLSCAFCAWYLVLWSIFLLGLHVARKRYARLPTSEPPVDPLPADLAPGVSILRPLRGLDTNLYENLEASFLQDYPKFEIIFSVADEADAAIPIVHELTERYPNVEAKLLIGEEIVGVNPKINNLIRPYREAKYDLLWVLDSNVLTLTTTLSRSVPLFTPRDQSPSSRPIGLVHHLPFAVYPDTLLGSRVEQVYMCSTHSKMYLAINQVQIASCVTGKSCLYKKSDLIRAAERKLANGKLSDVAQEQEPGLATFGQYLGEDNEIGVAIWEELGMRHAMGGEMAGNTVGTMSFTKYFRRRVRWIRVRKYMVLASTLVEPLTECLVAGILGSLALRHLFSIPPIVFLPVQTAVWFYHDLKMYRALLPSSPAPSSILDPPHHDGPSWSYLKAWALREALALPIWLFAMLGDTVGWRDEGRVYKVRRDGSVRELKVGEKEAAIERVWAVVVQRWKGVRGKGYVELTPDDVEARIAPHTDPK